MKAYFAGSIRAGRQDAEIYRTLIKGIQVFGQVLTEHVGSDLPLSGENIPSSDIYQRDRRWIDEADVVVAEVTQPSTGVGYEIGYAEAHAKPVYCLFRPTEGKRISGMIEDNPACTILMYTDPLEVMQRLQAILKH